MSQAHSHYTITFGWFLFLPPTTPSGGHISKNKSGPSIVIQGSSITQFHHLSGYSHKPTQKSILLVTPRFMLILYILCVQHHHINIFITTINFLTLIDPFISYHFHLHSISHISHYQPSFHRVYYFTTIFQYITNTFIYSTQRVRVQV